MAVGVNLGVRRAQQALGAEADALIAVAYAQRKGTVTADIFTVGFAGIFGLLGGLFTAAARRRASDGGAGLQAGALPRGMLLVLLPESLVIISQGDWAVLDRLPVGSFTITGLGSVVGVAQRYALKTSDGRDFILDVRKLGASRPNVAAMDVIANTGQAAG